MVFDISIGLDTLNPLARYLGYPVVFFSLIFAVIDTGVSIGASGVLSSTPIGKLQARRIYSWILRLLTIIKLGLFIGFMLGHTSDDIDIMSIIMNSLFVIIIYTLFHFTGSGLLYNTALIWFKIYSSLMIDEMKLKAKINKYCIKFKHKCKLIKVPEQDAIKEFNLDNICNNIY